MVCGTTSDAGKSTVVAGLCRLLARRGVRVAPFKAQNMALNSFVTADGGEIGRSQAAQAFAAGVQPDVAMNPVLLKPSGERSSQVVVLGKPIGERTAAEYQAPKAELLEVALDCLADLRRRFDVVICEGAGSPAEINLLDGDIANLRVAVATGIPAVLVGDIERGGVFASLYGTAMLLPDDQRSAVRGFVINKFRGDPALLGDGGAQLESLTGIPLLGVLPWTAGLDVDAEDSLALAATAGGAWAGWSVEPGVGSAADHAEPLDVAVVRYPRIANFTDVEPLGVEAGVVVRFVTTVGELGRPDLVALIGSKATASDFDWLRERRLDRAIKNLIATGGTVLGVCGGYQMLGRRIIDEEGIEGTPGTRDGMGLLDVDSVFRAEKVLRQRRGAALGEPVNGYHIHNGRVRAIADRDPEEWLVLEPERIDDVRAEGFCSPDRSVFGTSLHGLFEPDAFRKRFLALVAERAGKPWAPSGESFAARREARVERIADLIEGHLDVDRLLDLIAG